jgi:iron complex outermembrane receptor protein
VAYTYLDATYTDAYTTCTAAPCTAASPANKSTVAAGNRLPGIPENNFYTAIRWGGDVGLYASINFQYLSDIAVNDLNTIAAPSYELVGADAGYGIELSSLRLDAFVRVNNALDKDYVGSIIVNDGNGRFFEPGSAIGVLAGVSVRWK